MNNELICLILWLTYNIQTQKNMTQEQKLHNKTKNETLSSQGYSCVIE